MKTPTEYLNTLIQLKTRVVNGVTTAYHAVVGFPQRIRRRVLRWLVLVELRHAESTSLTLVAGGNSPRYSFEINIRTVDTAAAPAPTL